GIREPRPSAGPSLPRGGRASRRLHGRSKRSHAPDNRPGPPPRSAERGSPPDCAGSPAPRRRRGASRSGSGCAFRRRLDPVSTWFAPPGARVEDAHPADTDYDTGSRVVTDDPEARLPAHGPRGATTRGEDQRTTTE